MLMYRYDLVEVCSLQIFLISPRGEIHFGGKFLEKIRVRTIRLIPSQMNQGSNPGSYLVLFLDVLAVNNKKHMQQVDLCFL